MGSEPGKHTLTPWVVSFLRFRRLPLFEIGQETKCTSRMKIRVGVRNGVMFRADCRLLAYSGWICIDGLRRLNAYHDA